MAIPVGAFNPIGPLSIHQDMPPPSSMRRNAPAMARRGQRDDCDAPGGAAMPIPMAGAVAMIRTAATTAWKRLSVLRPCQPIRSRL